MYTLRYNYDTLEKPPYLKGTKKGVLFTNERHAFSICSKKVC